MHSFYGVYLFIYIILFQGIIFNNLPLRAMNNILPEEVVVSPQYPVPMVQLDRTGHRRAIYKCSVGRRGSNM